MIRGRKSRRKRDSLLEVDFLDPRFV